MADPVMPMYYHGRVRESDREWIRKRMAVIPADIQGGVASEYSRIFRLGHPEGGRKKANEYLHGVAVEYRDEMRARQ